MRARTLVTAFSLASLSAVAAGPTHCAANEQTFFNCTVRGGKVASVCGSKDAAASSGYVQYRFGVPGRIELQFPTSLAQTQRRFSLESHRPYQGESELLHFAVDGYEYSVYQAAGTDPKPFRSAGVMVSRATEGGTPVHADFKCSGGRIARLSALSAIVAKAE